MNKVTQVNGHSEKEGYMTQLTKEEAANWRDNVRGTMDIVRRTLPPLSEERKRCLARLDEEHEAALEAWQEAITESEAVTEGRPW